MVLSSPASRFEKKSSNSACSERRRDFPSSLSYRGYSIRCNGDIIQSWFNAWRGSAFAVRSILPVLGNDFILFVVAVGMGVHSTAPLTSIPDRSWVFAH